MNSKSLHVLSSSNLLYFILDGKKKSGKRIKIVDNQQQKVKKLKVAEKINEISKIKNESSGPSKGSSIDEGKKMLEWIISPLTLDEFLSKHWEKKPKLIKRDDTRDYYSSLLSTEMINTVVKDHYLEYTKNIDITSYREGVRETHNPEGRAVS